MLEVNMHPFFSPQPSSSNKPKSQARLKTARKRKARDFDNESDQNGSQSQAKRRRKDPNIANSKTAISNAIDANTVDFKDDSTIPNELLRNNCKWPYDKDGNAIENGDYIVCRMIIYDSNKNAKHCNKSYKYSKNNGYDAIAKHYQSKHSEKWNEWKSKQVKQNTKHLKKNTASLKDVPVSDYKKELARIMAEGFCTNYRPFLLANDRWIAKVASLFTHIGSVHGYIEADAIYDSV